MSTERLFTTINTIELKGLSKKYDTTYAVKDLSLTVNGGELLILIGGSGSGKTTTLKMINRIITPDTGSIHINNIDISTIDEVILRRNIGYVIQQIGLFPHLSIRDNIGLIPRLENWTKHLIDERVKILLQMVDLPSDIYMHRYPQELSGGQQQRVGLARALAMDPRLLLMDEPFGALDPILRRQLHEEFINLKKEINRTIIFVTHDINEAFKLGDRIAVMHESRLQQIGTPQELLLNPVNDMVSDLVDAKYKFKHLDTLNVKDIMTPIHQHYLLPQSTTIQQIKHHFTKHTIELAIITKNQEFNGIITLKNLHHIADKQSKVEDQIETPLIFSPTDSIASALQKMKIQKQSIAVVLKENKPVGLLLSDEILLNLI
ncbi:MAG: ATP-binding cassette domain-containing protein [Candidatus Thermoplasmatota archaeon]|nr:ATP-binding cassette domain-containing protein [Candidatus Thermoplasmatota archaeon]MBU1940490.1 ATP-binding cassette domain-containing protein [Candidatus Thermoplasmatota archaeon]